MMRDADADPSADRDVARHVVTAPEEGPLRPVTRDADADDHDLLTYGEVAARLGEEIAALQQHLTDLEARTGRGEDLSDELARARGRLEVLRAAQGRYSGRETPRAFLDYGSGATP